MFCSQQLSVAKEHLKENVHGRVRLVDPAFQLDCLEMSLASDLDLLSDLKELYELHHHGVVHRLVCDLELEWMSKNWPRLEKVTGLFDNRFSTLEPDVHELLKANDSIGATSTTISASILLAPEHAPTPAVPGTGQPFPRSPITE